MTMWALRASKVRCVFFFGLVPVDCLLNAISVMIALGRFIAKTGSSHRYVGINVKKWRVAPDRVKSENRKVKNIIRSIRVAKDQRNVKQGCKDRNCQSTFVLPWI